LPTVKTQLLDGDPADPRDSLGIPIQAHAAAAFERLDQPPIGNVIFDDDVSADVNEVNGKVFFRINARIYPNAPEGRRPPADLLAQWALDELLIVVSAAQQTGG
jgi:hypothetical protein